MQIPVSDWRDVKVLVTGGAGFLGSRIVQLLRDRGAAVAVPRKREFDLTRVDDALRCMQTHQPRVVIHAAAHYGGIAINQLHPAKIFYENLIMGAHVFEAARQTGVERLVVVGTACSYPGALTDDLTEERLWDGPCHESVVNYGLTKKMLAVQGWAYRKEYGLDSIHLLLTNLYGPGDTFEPTRSHVGSALIRKFVEAQLSGAREVEVWGTGTPVRELLYVDDCAEGIVRAAERYDSSEPLNLGTGQGTSIRELAELIRELTGVEATIRWNSQRPDGAARKVLNVERMRGALDWQPPTTLREGLRRTIDWYRAHKDEADRRA